MVSEDEKHKQREAGTVDKKKRVQIVERRQTARK